MSVSADEVTSLGDQMTVRDAVTRSKISKSHLYDLLDRGAIASYRIGRARKVSRRSLECYLEMNYVPSGGSSPRSSPTAAPGRPSTAPPDRASAAPPVATPGSTRSTITALEDALEAAEGCCFCFTGLQELVTIYDPTHPDPVDDWRLCLQGASAVVLQDLKEAILDGLRAIPGVTKVLMRTAPPRLTDRSRRAGSMTKGTAHQTALTFACFALDALWRVTDPVGFRETQRTQGDEAGRIALFDPRATALRVPDVWKTLAAVLLALDGNGIFAACHLEANWVASAARAGLVR